MGTNNRGVAAFVVLAFGLGWTLWEVPVLLGLPVTGRMGQLYLLPGAFAPALAAIVVRAWITREGFADAGLNPNLRQWRYYLFAWLLPFPVAAVIAVEAMMTGLGAPDFSLARGLTELNALPESETLRQDAALAVPMQLAFTALPAAFLLWGEEFGWRGYLQQRLFAGAPLRAAAATGLIWGAWHFPLILRGVPYTEHPYLGLLMFPVGAVLLSVIFGWLRAKTGSVWAPSLAHASANSIGVSLTALWFAGGDPIVTGYLGVLGWIPLGAVCAWVMWRGRLREAVPPAPGTG